MTQITTTKDLQSILKVDGKGWDPTIFQEDTDSHLCASCHAVYCDVAELGCLQSLHDVTDIYSYCQKCLQTLIDNNGGKCPINNHPDPIIVPTRAARRRILQSKVLCPNSSLCKNSKGLTQKNDKVNIGNAVIIDSSGPNQEEKEGMMSLTPDVPSVTADDAESSYCSWMGSLEELIANHLAQCMTTHNAEYMLQIENTKLKEENERLRKLIGMALNATRLNMQNGPKHFIMSTSNGYLGCSSRGWLRSVANPTDAVIFECEQPCTEQLYTHFKVHRYSQKSASSKYKGHYISYQSGSWAAGLYPGKQNAVVIEYCLFDNSLICRGMKDMVWKNEPQRLAFNSKYFYWRNDYSQCSVDLVYVNSDSMSNKSNCN